MNIRLVSVSALLPLIFTASGLAAPVEQVNNIDQCDVAWNIVAKTIDREVLENFLVQCPNSTFLDAAHKRMELLIEASRGSVTGFGQPKMVHTEKIKP